MSFFQSSIISQTNPSLIPIDFYNSFHHIHFYSVFLFPHKKLTFLHQHFTISPAIIIFIQLSIFITSTGFLHFITCVNTNQFRFLMVCRNLNSWLRIEIWVLWFFARCALYALCKKKIALTNETKKFCFILESSILTNISVWR